MEISLGPATILKQRSGIVLIRKNVSLDEVHLQKLQPLLEKNGGNLSAAIREVIDLFSLCPESHETLKETAESLKRKESLPEIREQFLRSGEYVMINQQMMKWLMRSSAGKLIDKDIVHGLINLI
ncbi:hypothetical protein [Methanosarcina horonobensis]|uniref:hypothetical protein n=1 Tax=Methanosarcina horonobensis TaxID=418008 RepID=UPI000B27F94B|nr:hypothetical protein [Methanosarcina horonobensis]